MHALFFVPAAVLGMLVARLVNLVLGIVFRGFNRLFDRVTPVYGWTVGWLLRLSAIVLVVYGGLIGLTYFGLTRVPTGFIPTQDKGYLIVNMQLPDAASLERTMEVTRSDRKDRPRDRRALITRLSIPGQSFVLNAISSNFASMFVVLEPFHDRHDTGPGFRARSPTSCGCAIYREIQEAQVAVFGAPPVDGLGNAGGFKLMVEDRERCRVSTMLQGQADNLAEQGNQQPGHRGRDQYVSAPTRRSCYVDVNRIEVQDDGRAAERRLRHAAVLPGRLLRERFQSSSAAPGR